MVCAVVGHLERWSIVGNAVVVHFRDYNVGQISNTQFMETLTYERQSRIVLTDVE